jgi:hypothetical protein
MTRAGFCATALIVLFAAAGYAQISNSPRTPDFTVQVWGQAATDFDALRGYAAFRAKLENGSPAQTPRISNIGFWEAISSCTTPERM